MYISKLNHTIISIVLLLIIFIGTLLTKITTVETFDGNTNTDPPVEVCSDPNSEDCDLLAVDSLALPIGRRNILLHKIESEGNTSDNLATLCDINLELITQCQQFCTEDLDNNNKIARGCYNYCLDASGIDKTHIYKCDNMHGYTRSGRAYDDASGNNNNNNDSAAIEALNKCKVDWINSGIDITNLPSKIDPLATINEFGIDASSIPLPDDELDYNQLFYRYRLSTNQ